MTTNIYEYREKIIKEIYKFAETADVESYELNNEVERAKNINANFREFAKGKNTWRDFIYDSEDVIAIDNIKEILFKVINNLSKDKREKKLDENKKSTNFWEKQTNYWQERSDWWKKYNNNELDWQKDLKKREEENKKQLQESEKNKDEKDKQRFITDIEMELTKENISDERLSKRVGVSDWREKIRGADGFYQALSMRSHLWDIIRKLKDEYTCANCGVKKEEFTVHEKGNNKYCSYECKNAAEGKEEKPSKRKNDSPSTNHGDNFGFSSVSEFFAWMKKLGVEKIEFDFNTNQVVISCNGSKKLNISDSSNGLTTKQQEALKERFNSEKTPITFSEVSNEFNKEKNNKGNGGIVAAIIIVGIFLAAIIGVVVYKSRKKDY